MQLSSIKFFLLVAALKDDARLVILENHGPNLQLCLGRGGASGGKFRITLGLPVGALINCADNTGRFLKLKLYGMIEKH